MIGKHLSHYLIESELGRGGMGIVYKAMDTKLDRTVAIKVLPSAALTSDDDRARFYREAKAAAALTHPHIAIIHAVDEAVPEGAPHGTEPSPFIAMEYIDGETLEARIKQGPLKLEEAIRIAGEIASALKLAHENEIVHRDIKSANVMLTASNTAKVLDFGLAQTAASTKLTQMGSTLGTVAYMSPEQTRGELVDCRTDIWSLGAVLYEMIAGRAPFGGDYEQALVYSILNEDPEPLTAIRTGVAMDVEWIVSKCLTKKIDERYQSATDLIVDLKRVASTTEKQAAGMSRAQSAVVSRPHSGAALSSASIETTPPGDGRISAPKTWAVLIGVVLIGLGGLLGSLVLPSGSDDTPAPQMRKLELLLPGIQSAAFPVISPDKEWISFIGTDTLRRSGLFLLETSTGKIHYTQGSEVAAEHAAFSPDVNKIAFTQYGAGAGVYVSVIPGGVPKQIADFGRVPVWFDDHSLAVVDYSGDGRPHIVDLETGVTTDIPLGGNPALDGNHLYWSTRLPASRILIADIEPDQQSGEAGTLAFIDTDADKLIVSEPGIINPFYTPDGFLVYQRGSDRSPLMARAFDIGSFRFTGQPEELLPNMSWRAFSVGADGSLIYSPSEIVTSDGEMSLFVLNTDDHSVEKYDFHLPQELRIGQPVFSPVDPDLLLVRVSNPVSGLSNLSVYNLKERTLTQRSFSGSPSWATWSADGKSIYTGDLGTSQLLKIDLESGGSTEVVAEKAHTPASSPDGKWLAMTVGDDNKWDLYLMNLESGELTPVDTTSGFKYRPQFSPDSRYVVYVSVVGLARGIGRIHVAEVNGPGRYAITSRLVYSPQWSANGNHLFFRDDTDKIYRLQISTKSGVSVTGQAEQIGRLGLGRAYSVSQNSPRLAIIATEFRQTGIEQTRANSSLIWWENWTQELK